MCLSCEYIALKSGNDEYSSKVHGGSAKQNTLLDLAWKVDELNTLSSNGHSLRTEVVSIKELLDNPNSDILGANVARRLTNLHERLVAFVRGESSLNVLDIVCLVMCAEF